MFTRRGPFDKHDVQVSFWILQNITDQHHEAHYETKEFSEHGAVHCATTYFDKLDKFEGLQRAVSCSASRGLVVRKACQFEMASDEDIGHCVKDDQRPRTRWRPVSIKETWDVHLPVLVPFTMQCLQVFCWGFGTPGRGSLLCWLAWLWQCLLDFLWAIVLRDAGAWSGGLQAFGRGKPPTT